MSILLQCAGGTVERPRLVLVDRKDGGHLVVNPPREVWERSELSPLELTLWSFLVAATGQSMLEELPQLLAGPNHQLVDVTAFHVLDDLKEAPEAI